MPRRSFGRPSDARLRRRTLLIVCEGTATEALYFRALKAEHGRRTPSIKLVPSSRAPLSIVRTAQKIFAAGEIDEVWCVFDHEFPPDHRTFLPAAKEAEDSDFRLAVSNPAFEFWLLLHFGATTHQFTGNDELHAALLGKYPTFTKAREETYAELRPRQSAAIANAKQVLRDMSRGNPTDRFPNPSTFVHEMIERLLILQ